MRLLLVAALIPLVFALSATPAPAQPSIVVTWTLDEDLVGDDGRASSRSSFTIVNRAATPLPARGWAIYYTALHAPATDSVSPGFRIEAVTGSLFRLEPVDGVEGVPPGGRVTITYRTRLLPNHAYAPNGVYVVFDAAPAVPQSVAYEAVPFERRVVPGRPPRVITAAAQFDLDATVSDVADAALPLVFPTPIRVERADGDLVLARAPEVMAGPGLQGEAALARSYLDTHFVNASRPSGPAPGLHLEVGRVEGQPAPEAYELAIDPKAGIHIVGNSPAGVFYGLQSLRGLMPVPGRAPDRRRPGAAPALTLPALRVVDAPRFAYRGLMLDVARNFQPKAQIFRVLDLMARYKLNVLHFHLTEDEGWRLEIEGLPELTEVGGRRGHTLDSSRHLPPAFGSGGDLANPYGSGWYSRADYVEILRYAATRHIQVIPEIEMPGHARAAVKAMEARARRLRAAGNEAGARQFLLSDPDDESVYRSVQGYTDNVMNPALPSTYAFIEHVVSRLAAMHREAGVPLRNLHLGGDEVPAGVWEQSPAVAAVMQARGLQSVDDLWYEFYGRVAEIVRAHGLTPSGWEEIGLRKTRLDGRPKWIPNPEFAARGWTAYVWNNAVGGGAEDLPYRMANAGYQVVLCPVSNLYFDLAWNRNPEEPGLNWGGYVNLRKPFEFIPFDYYRNTREDQRGNPIDRSAFVGKDRLTDYGRDHIVGIQGNLWAETLGADGRLDYMLVPKLLGLAERAWAPDPSWAREPDDARADALFREAWSTFVHVLGRRELPRLDRETPPWRYRIPTPGLKVVDGQVRTSLEIPGFVLRYTTDGNDPTPRSPEVRGPLVPSPGLRVAAFDTNGRRGHSARLDP